VLVTARRLNELGVVDAELAAPAPVEETTRALSAPEFIGDEPAELGPGELGPGEVGPGELGPAELGPAGLRPAEVSLVRAAR
jgi:hypothetical protein